MNRDKVMRFDHACDIVILGDKQIITINHRMGNVI